jgi:hypothetical protein
VSRNPILKPLDTISNRDALIDEDGSEAFWPESDFIIGNPPFLGDKKMRGELGDDYVDRVRGLFEGRVPGSADFVTFWFEKAGEQIRSGHAKGFGLVATNGIRKGSNNDVLRRAIAEESVIFNAWSDHPWHDESGAAVRVSLVSIGSSARYGDEQPLLDGELVQEIMPGLTSAASSGGVDLGTAMPLKSNQGMSFNGLCLAGDFRVPAETAQNWLLEPNPSGQPNSDVLRPLYNGKDISARWKGQWVVDFGLMEEEESAMYAAPFLWVEEKVKPLRVQNKRASRRRNWWKHGENRPGMRAALTGLERYLITPETAKHRYFVWLEPHEAPEHGLVVFSTADSGVFGSLQSRIHLVWMLATGNRLGIGNDPRYNSSKVFWTFPLPDTDDMQHGEIKVASEELDRLRRSWLNPPEWTETERLEFPATVGGPWHSWIPNADALEPGSVHQAQYVRTKAKPGHEADLKKRTLTNLYNDRPAWLDIQHKKLDEAVAAAYGWPADLPDSEILKRLLELNLERAALEK